MEHILIEDFTFVEGLILKYVLMLLLQQMVSLLSNYKDKLVDSSTVGHKAP